jgi:microfibrillar-associated protein 1
MPTAEDKRDFQVMPGILQKRAGTFGRKGQSKWTHLTAEDTTNFDPNSKVTEDVAKKL